MTRAEYQSATNNEIIDWLQAAGWRPHYFMGWALDVHGKTIHCNTSAAIEEQLRRDRRKLPAKEPGK